MGITINIGNGNLGKVADLGNGVGGLIILLATAPTEHAFGVVKSYTRYDDLPAGLQAVEAAKLYFQLAEGRKVYIMPVASTVAIEDIVDKTAGTPYAKNLIDAGNGDISFIGVVGTLAHTAVSEAVTNAHALATDALAAYSPVLVVLPAAYNAALPDLTTGSKNMVAVVSSEHGDEVGLLIGRFASTPVQRHPGRVKDGSMPITAPVIGDKTIDTALDRVADNVDKGYITLTTIIGKSGYYFSNADTATSATDDYSSVMNRRVIDKAVRAAYLVYVEELKDELQINNDGTLAPSVVKHFQGLIENAIGLQLTANGNISNARAYVDETQNVLSTSKIEVTLSILPVGYSEEIVVNLGFTTSLE